MKIFFFSAIVCYLIVFDVFAQDVYVKGYYKKNGEYVGGHFRSPKNDNFYDNFSTRGNFNPYTLKEGWKREKNYISYKNYFGSKKIFDDDKFEKAILENDINKIDYFLDGVNSDIKSLFKVLSYTFVDKYDQARLLGKSILNTSSNQYVKNELKSLLKNIDYILANKELSDLGIDYFDIDIKQNSYENIKNILPKLFKVKEYENKILIYLISTIVYTETKDIDGLVRLKNSPLNDINHKLTIDDAIELVNKRLIREKISSENKLKINIGLLFEYLGNVLNYNILNIPIDSNVINRLESFYFKYDGKSFIRFSADELTNKNYGDGLHVRIDSIESLKIYRLVLMTNDSLMYNNYLEDLKSNIKFNNYGKDSCVPFLREGKIDFRFGHPEFPYNIEFYRLDEYFFMDIISLINDKNRVILYNENE